MSTASAPLAVASDLPLPAQAQTPPLDAMMARSGPVFMGVFSPNGTYPHSVELRRGVEAARSFLAAAEAQMSALRAAAEPLPRDEVGRQLKAFVAAWPNASNADLAGYGAQLVDDVLDRRPCRYALRCALRDLRQSSRFLPSISEVLTALDSAQARVRNTVWHILQLPEELEKARIALIASDRRERAGSVGPFTPASAGNDTGMGRT